MEGTSQSEVASICEWSDDQATSVAEILIAIGELGIDGPHQKFIIPVVSIVKHNKMKNTDISKHFKSNKINSKIGSYTKNTIAIYDTYLQ